MATGVFMANKPTMATGAVGSGDHLFDMVKMMSPKTGDVFLCRIAGNSDLDAAKSGIQVVIDRLSGQGIETSAVVLRNGASVETLDAAQLAALGLQRIPVVTTTEQYLGSGCILSGGPGRLVSGAAERSLFPAATERRTKITITSGVDASLVGKKPAPADVPAANPFYNKDERSSW